MNIAIGVGLCMLSCAMAGLGMGLATGKAVDGVARQPEASGKINSILLLGLALTESTAIYGFVTAFMIFVKAGILSGGTELTVMQGVYLFACALPIAVVGLISAISQGRVAAAGINLVSRRPGAIGQAITNAALVETYAIFALLVSLLPIISFNA